MNINVSIIIVNYNTKDLTQDCIDSIRQQTSGVSYEIVVVDNSSTDGSKEHFIKDDSITYIYNDQNLGFGRANNIGIRASHGEYVFLLNSDTIILNNAISLFYEYAMLHPNMVLGCYLQDKDGRYSPSFHYFPAFTITEFLRRKLCLKKYIAVDYKEHDVECLCGADMFIPRFVIDKVGGFDENIFLYGEEGELQYRMHKQHIVRHIINTPQIIHLEGKSMEDTLEKLKIKYESHFYVLSKYMTNTPLKLAKLYYYFRFILRYWRKRQDKEIQSILSIFK